MRVVVRVVLLRSTITVAMVLLVAVAVWLSLSARTPGFLLRPDLITGLTTGSLFTGLIAAGAAATEANRWQRTDRVRRSAAGRSQVSIRLVHVLAVIAPLAVGYALAIVVIAAWAEARGYYGDFSVTWLIGLLCSLVLASAFGYAVGAVAPVRWFVGPAVALAFYVGYVALALARVRYGVQALYPASVELDDIFVQPVYMTILARSVLHIALSVLLLMLMVAPALSRRVVVGGAVALLAVSVASGSVVVAANGQMATARNPGVFTCVGDAPELCLNPGYARAAEPLQSEFARVAAITEGTGLVAPRLEQNLEGFGDEPSPGARSVYLDQWADAKDLAVSVDRYVGKYGGSANCDMQGTQGLPETTHVHEQIDRWLSQYDPDDGSVSPDPVVERLARLSPEDAHAWFTSVADRYESCSLQLSDLP
jgi:hypothetical protein